MKHFKKHLIAVCVLALTTSSWAVQWPMWEFNNDGDIEAGGCTGKLHTGSRLKTNLMEMKNS